MFKLNKKKFAVIIIIAIIAIAFVGCNTIKIIAFNTISSPLKTQKINENLFVIKTDYSNFFLIKTSDGKYISIDAGVSDASEELSSLDIKPEDIKLVLLTHSHEDHTYNLPLFKKADVYVQTNESLQIKEEIKKNKSRIADPIVLSKIKFIENIDFDTNIQLIQTPGHTPGSVSFLLNNKYLFVGDAWGDCVSQSLIKKIVNKDKNLAKESEEKLQKLFKDKVVYTAHCGMYKF